jgi:hypothetical protein
MRVTVLVLLCLFTEIGRAEASVCQAIPDPVQRLACYNPAAPPSAPAPARSTAASPTSAAPAQPDRLIDRFAIENKKLDAKIKAIWARPAEPAAKVPAKAEPAQPERFIDQLAIENE